MQNIIREPFYFCFYNFGQGIDLYLYIKNTSTFSICYIKTICNSVFVTFQIPIFNGLYYLMIVKFKRMTILTNAKTISVFNVRKCIYIHF